MTREKALKAMDRFVAMGYTVTFTERDLGAHGMVFIDQETKEMTSVARHLSISEISLDKVDLRAIVAAADELDLDAGMSRVGSGDITLTDAPSEAEQRKREVVGKRRAHPR